MNQKSAPRDAASDSLHSREMFRSIHLGHPIYLKVKTGEDKSMSEKRRTQEGVDGVVLQVPHDTVKAVLPEPQSPVVEYHTRSLQRLYGCAVKRLPSVFRQSSFCLMGDRK